MSVAANEASNVGPAVPWYLKETGSFPAVPPQPSPQAPAPAPTEQFVARPAADPTPAPPQEEPRNRPPSPDHGGSVPPPPFVPHYVQPAPPQPQPEPTPAPGPVRARNRTAVLALVLAAVVVIAGGTTYALTSGSGDDTAASGTTTQATVPQPADSGRTTAAPRTTQAAASTSATPTPTVDPEVAALNTLDQYRRSSLAGLQLDDRWVAQVASKSVGITDPLQTAANGSHTFYAVDILAEVNSMQSLLSGTPVLVLQSVDFGRYSVDGLGQPYWVTIADPGFANADAVDLWCARTFPTLSAAELANACAPRTLGPSHP